VEQLGAGCWSERFQTLAESALELIWPLRIVLVHAETEQIA
jgi:hypothetical protein